MNLTQTLSIKIISSIIPDLKSNLTLDDFESAIKSAIKSAMDYDDTFVEDLAELMECDPDEVFSQIHCYNFAPFAKALLPLIDLI